MKKYWITAAMVVCAATAFAQKAEISAAEKAYNSGDYAAALQQVAAADQIIKSNEKYIDPSMRRKNLYLNAMSLFSIASGNDQALKQKYPKAQADALKLFNVLAGQEKKPVFSAKEVATKKTIYFLNKAEWEKGVASGALKSPKTIPANKEYTQKFRPLLNGEINKLYTNVEKSYNDKDYLQAAKDLQAIFELSKAAADKPDTLSLYNAASFYLNAQDYKKAAAIYENLLKMKFTGKRTIYSGVNKASGQVMNFDDKAKRDQQVKIGFLENPSQKVEPNKQPEIYKTLVQIYIREEATKDKAIKFAQEGFKKYPKDPASIDLVLLEGQIYYERGQMDKFLKNLETAAKQNPGNPDVLYNIGVVNYEMAVKEKDAENPDTAKINSMIAKTREYYDKALKVDPKYINAYINQAAILLDEARDVQLLIDEMPLRLNKEQVAQLKAYEAQKKDFYVKATEPLLKAYEIDANNSGVISTLKNIYYQLGDTPNFEKFKAAEDKLKEIK